jgi:hypothetical protein
MVPVEAPIAEIDPIKRLKMVQAAYESLQTSVLPTGFAILLKIVGLLSSVVNSTLGDSPAIAIFTNFPGPRNKGELLGETVSDVRFTGGVMKGVGIFIHSISYGGKLLMGNKICSSLFPYDGKEAKRSELFLRLAIKELDVLADNFV